jgi:hypothetical protein
LAWWARLLAWSFWLLPGAPFRWPGARGAGLELLVACTVLLVVGLVLAGANLVLLTADLVLLVVAVVFLVACLVLLVVGQVFLVALRMLPKYDFKVSLHTFGKMSKSLPKAPSIFPIILA